MADSNIKKRTFEIEIAGVKESVTNLESLEQVLDKMEKQVENINSKGGFSVVSKESNKNTKEAIDLAKAEQIAQGEVISSYKDKQAAMRTLGKEIKTMTVADDEATRKQQEMIQQYNGLNDQLKRFDAAMGNHQRNVGDYRGALKETTMQIKEMQGEMAQMLLNGIDKADPKFKALAQKAGELQDAIKDAKEEVGRFASDTKKLDDVINIAQSATAAFELYKGAMSAFGIETEEAEKAMQKLVGAMSVIQSLQQLSNTLQEGSATAKLFSVALKATGAELVINQVNAVKAAAAQEGLSTAQKAGAVASKTLGLAMKAIPLMFIIGLVATLITHWEDLVGWFENTFPALKKMGGAMNALKGVVVGLGKAVVHWLINPWETFAKVIKKILAGDFSGAITAAAEGIKKQFTGLADNWKEGFQEQVERGMEEMSRKAAAEMDKTITHQKNMITKQKNADGTYRKEYIEANKKMFENRKKMYKKDSDEYRKVLEEEAAFNQQVEDAKTAATEKAAAKRAAANKKAAADAEKAAKEAAKQEEEAAKKVTEANKKLDDAFYKSFQADIKEDLRKAELEVEKFADGPVDKLIDALYEVEAIKGELLEGEETKTFNDLWNNLDKNYQKVFGSVKEMREQMGYLTLDQLEAQEQVKKSFSGTTKAIKDQIEAFQKGVEEVQTNIQTIQKNAETNRNILDKESAVKLAEGFRKTAQAELKNAENLYKNFLENIKNVDVEPIRNKFTGIIDEKATAKKLEGVKALWVDVSQKINAEVVDTEAHWNQLIARLEQIYTKDSQIYNDAVQQKIDALTKLKKMQEEVAKRADNPVNPTKTDYNGDGTPEVKKPEKFLWADKDRKKQNGDPYSVVDNLANLFNELDEMVLGPAMDTFQMYMDFAIEETQKKLEEVQDMHDDALDKVEESANKIKELNDSLKDSSNTNLEATKQQLADEQLLYAQRLAEEQKLAEREKDLKNKANEQEYKSRQMELGYQLVMAVANTAQGASKALAQWGWPLGPIFAGTMAALGAVQSALILKQMNALEKPKKLAEGGLLEGPSHSQGGIKIPNTNIEVEGKEFIVNKRSTKKYLPLLEAINAEGKRSFATTDKRIRKFANGGTMNFDRVDDNLKANNETNRLLNAIDGIDMQPVVAVKDIWKVEDRLVKVRSLAGK